MTIETPLAFSRWPLRDRESITIFANEIDPYLTRFYLNPNTDWWRRRLGLPGAYVHFFWRGDLDRELHCHPWEKSASVILTGGYTEERMVGGRWDPVRRVYENPRIVTRVFRPGSVNLLRSDTFHRVTLLKPEEGCLTLFFAGKNVPGEDQENWGFITRDGKHYETCGERDRRLAREKRLRQEERLP